MKWQKKLLVCVGFSCVRFGLATKRISSIRIGERSREKVYGKMNKLYEMTSLKG